MPWLSPNLPPEGMYAELDRQVQQLEDRNPNLLPDLRQGNTIVVASDYAGDHGNYHIISLFITTTAYTMDWERSRQHVRAKHLGQRTMSFKGLNDQHRRAALLPFLEAANQIEGLSITVAVDHRITDITGGFGRENFPKWKRKVWESMLRVTGMIGFFVAGLAAPGQHLLWITDNDDIAANAQHLKDLDTVFKVLSGAFLRFPMGECQIVTTSMDEPQFNKQMEDYAAIPDLVAGTLSEVLSNACPSIPSPLIAHLLPPRSWKTDLLLKWFCLRSQPLRKLVCVMSPGQAKGEIVAWWPEFSGITAQGLRV